MANTKLILPSVSVVTATYDGSLDILSECLGRVRDQDYPQDKIEIILGHGGSKEFIAPILKRYKCKVVYVPKHLQNAEYNRGVAFNRAKNNLVLILDHDNFMPTKNYLKELVQPILIDPTIVATESCYFHYDRSFSPLDRYYALIGTLDPIPFYLGKADRMPQWSKSWSLLGRSIDRGTYYEVEFDKDPRKIPTIGTNGCLMRRNLVKKYADTRPGHHYPIDVMVDVIKSGHNRFGFVKNSLIHLTGSRGLASFLKRRFKFVNEYHFADNSKRRYSVFMPGDEAKLLLFVLYSITLVVPTLDAIKGFKKIHDPAWFIHPLMCLGICFVYGWGTIKSKLK
ncbi:MAG: glycosyltransferase [Patescibacteria group bacterium]